MKFLICGLGSIGQRHYRNLLAMGHEVAAFRQGGGANGEFIQRFLDEEAKAGRPVTAFSRVLNAKEAFAPDAAVICSPNSCHLQTAIIAAHAGMHLFIEKPLSHTGAEVQGLLDMVRYQHLVSVVGYNLRWHPLLLQMRALLERGVIGTAIAANVECGECIEDWHPWEDYRETYAAKVSGGGGVVLCFSHDLDYLYWFFGKPSEVHAIGGKLTPLGGDAEDMVKAILEYSSGLIASVHLDYWQRPKRRRFEIIGTGGTLLWDYYAQTLTLTRRDDSVPSVYTVPEGFNRNDMFLAEMRDFVLAIEGKIPTPISLAEGRQVLDICLEIKRQIGR